MQLRYDDGRYVFDCRFDERLTAKNAGLQWDGQAKCWATASPDTAFNLIQYATPEARIAITKAREDSQKIMAMSNASAPTEDIQVPAPKGCTYMPFQLAGILFIAKKWRLT